MKNFFNFSKNLMLKVRNIKVKSVLTFFKNAFILIGGLFLIGSAISFLIYMSYLIFNSFGVVIGIITAIVGIILIFSTKKIVEDMDTV